ncbi:hypothetical protein EGR_11179 [Echinococcus granulosus]|uniref:Uncharacterized protein n=1 Tax=Echinococcus granulosus TaxID=6210 RepID=W6UKF3_ECHGR|nr:hypothetical protein EGR_11179 [Echinococcus granulosus]EUB53964.1 hypothetical protein EGR_11179 [Echinococcus granulosus]
MNYSKADLKVAIKSFCNRWLMYQAYLRFALNFTGAPWIKNDLISIAGNIDELFKSGSQSRYQIVLQSLAYVPSEQAAKNNRAYGNKMILAHMDLIDKALIGYSKSKRFSFTASPSNEDCWLGQSPSTQTAKLPAASTSNRGNSNEISAKLWQLITSGYFRRSTQAHSSSEENDFQFVEALYSLYAQCQGEKKQKPYRLLLVACILHETSVKRRTLLHTTGSKNTHWYFFYLKAASPINLCLNLIAHSQISLTAYKLCSIDSKPMEHV